MAESDEKGVKAASVSRSASISTMVEGISEEDARVER